jgi:hypothetical protein
MKCLGRVWRQIGERVLLGLAEGAEAVVATGLEEVVVGQGMAVEVAGALALDLALVLVWAEQVALLALCPLWPRALALLLLLHLEPLDGLVVQSPSALEIAPVRMQPLKSE